jgi:hypothetical protein
MDFWTLSIVRNSKYYKTQRFGNLICFRPKVRETLTLLGSLERNNINHCQYDVIRFGIRIYEYVVPLLRFVLGPFAVMFNDALGVYSQIPHEMIRTDMTSAGGEGSRGATKRDARFINCWCPLH